MSSYIYLSYFFFKQINGKFHCDYLTPTPGVTSIHIPVTSLESIFNTGELMEQNTRLSFVILLSDKIFSVRFHFFVLRKIFFSNLEHK